MATTIYTDTGDHKWSTAGNWSAGVPDATLDVTIAAGTTALIFDTVAVCKSINLTGTSGVTISGSGTIVVNGSLTLDSSVTWSSTGDMICQGAGTVTTANVDLVSVNTLIFRGATIGLGSNLIKTVGLVLFDSGVIFTTNNHTMTVFGIGGNSSSQTINLGSSVVNCQYMNFAGSTPTITSAGAAINVSPPYSLMADFGSTSWGDAVVTITIPDSAGTVLTIAGTNTFGTLNLAGDSVVSGTIKFPQGIITAAGAFSATGNAGGLVLTSSDGAHQAILSDTAGTNTVTNCTLSWLKAQGGATWDATGNIDGGNNTGWTGLGSVVVQQGGIW